MERVLNEMIGDLVKAANRHETLMDGTTAPVIKIIASADVVWGLFNDPEEEGLGGVIIKGSHLLDEAAAGKRRGRPLRCTAIKTVDRAMALAAREVFGDGTSEVDVAFPEVTN